MYAEWKENLSTRDRAWVPPIRKFLAVLHGGEAFTQVLPKVFFVLLAIDVPLLLSGWFAGWYFIYREYERWGLVLAFFAHFFLLAMLYLICRIVYLRATHISLLPIDDYAALRATAIGLRLIGEVILTLALGSLGYALLQPSLAEWFQTVGVAKYSSSMGSVSKLMATGVGCGGSLVGFILFFLLYAMASSIDGYLAIEYNTSFVQADTVKRQKELASRAVEVPPPPYQWPT